VTEEQTTEPLESLLDFVKRSRGFDFTGYKRSTLERRIAKRMEELGIESFQQYLDHLEVHQDEFLYLFNTILINVTGFMRDPEAWEYLAGEILPRLLRGRDDGDPIRVWSAGCASGEEPYTLAMLLAEAMGVAAYGERVKIYATDIDEQALDEARQAVYATKDVEDLPEHLRDRYLDRIDQRFVVRNEIRRSVIFGRNDLVQDAPISRVDLLVCRNTLMYFNAETQARILRRFHFGLNPGGFLFLGKSEMLITHADLFAPVNMRRRVFSKVTQRTLRDRLLFAAQGQWLGHVAAAGGDAIGRTAFDAAPVAQVVVDREGTLVLANSHARELLGIGLDQIGRRLQDLELSYRPVELRRHLDELYAQERGLKLPVTSAGGDGDVRRLIEVELVPLWADDEIIGAAVTYVDVTSRRRIQDELEQSKRELSQAYEELQSTVEELETTNEELQSTNEELETTNEELQSTNEELETMNEELHSTNEELETMNDELSQRSLELNEVNAFLETILSSMGVAVVVTDRSQRIRVWNADSEDLWGVRVDEAEGEHLANLDIGLPVERLLQPVRDCLSGAAPRAELSLPATDRRGRGFRCEITVLPLAAADGEISGVIVIMERREDGADG
jgi:two-component system, chemotaxis family, CheB/CheR fusion protein